MNLHLEQEKNKSQSIWIIKFATWQHKSSCFYIHHLIPQSVYECIRVCGSLVIS